jgi:hypothetical protein
VELSAEGTATRIVVLPGANIPAIIVGQPAPVPGVTRHNIRISNLFIDGNRSKNGWSSNGVDVSTSTARLSGRPAAVRRF